MEFKTIPVYPQDVKADRTVEGFAAVMGNIDDGNDRLQLGAFTKTLHERKARIAHLWQHDFESPPTATILALEEVKRNALPSEVLQDYPDATGGLFVSRKYLNTPRAEEVYQGILDGAIKGMSFGFNPVKRDFVKSGDLTIRNLSEVKLIETSDTPFPMNPAARAKKSFLLYNLLDQLNAIDDMTTIMAMGQSLTPDQLVACQQCVTMCLTLLNSAVQAGQLADMLDTLTPSSGANTSYDSASAPFTALRKAIAGAVWLHTPEEQILNAAIQRRGLKTAAPELFKQEIWSAEFMTQLQTKQGRMISAANEAKIKQVIDAIETQLETLEDLLGTAEPSADDETSAKSLTDTATLLALLELTLAESE